MAKKKKSTPSSTAPTAPAEPAAPATKGTESRPEGALDYTSVTGMLRHPTLLMAWFCFAMTMFSVAGMIAFLDNPDMGAAREPTGLIMWAAISLTLFASYRREMLRNLRAADTKR